MPKPLLFFASLLFAAASFEGCRSVPLDPRGEMIAVYQFGQFSMLLNTSSPTAVQAVRRALQSFDLYETGIVNRPHDAEFSARTRNDQKVIVTLGEVNRSQTLIRIRWGEGGDLLMSRRLYEAIEANLAR